MGRVSRVFVVLVLVFVGVILSIDERPCLR